LVALAAADFLAGQIRGNVVLLATLWTFSRHWHHMLLKKISQKGKYQFPIVVGRRALRHEKSRQLEQFKAMEPFLENARCREVTRNKKGASNRLIGNPCF